MDIITDATPEQGPPQRGGRGTRQRLIEAAVEVFADRGYHAASLAEVAARAGLTTGAVYSTFGSKKALLIAACTRGDLEGDIGGIREYLREAPSLRAGLEKLVLETAREGLNPAALRVIKLQMEVLKLGLQEPAVLEAVAAPGRQQLDAAATVIAELADRDGVTLPLPARELATLLSALLNGLQLIQLVDASVVTEQHFLDGLNALMGWPKQPTRR